MFFQQSKNGAKTIMVVYVDDIILIKDNTTEMERLKKCLAIEFKVKYLGQMWHLLGMEIARSKKSISVSQRKYIFD